MHTLDAPARDDLGDFESISAVRRNSDVRNILCSVRNDVAAAYDEYVTYEGNGCHLEPIDIGDDIKTELRNNFRLLDTGASHQEIRNDILELGRDNKCVFCSVTDVDSLDHLLPREVYPEFSVLALNLVPACSRCNRIKDRECFKATGNSLMHPYFTEMPVDPLLFVEVSVRQNAITWNYFLRRDTAIDEEAFSTIENLFVVLRLAELYRRHSVGEMQDRLLSMSSIYESGGPELLQEYLAREAESAKAGHGENYWKTAFLRALAASREFYEGGFQVMINRGLTYQN